MRTRGGELYGRVERAAEGRVRTCGRRSGRGAYVAVEYGEPIERGDRVEYAEELGVRVVWRWGGCGAG